MKRERKISTLVYIGILCSMVFMSCAGGHVSQNGLFQKDHKELKESLVGSWQIVDKDYEVAGQEMYEFYKDEKIVKLKVFGVEREMERFDSADGLTFSFEYSNEEGKKIYVLAQFKSNQRKELVTMQDLPASMPAALSMLKLEKRPKVLPKVVAGIKRNN